MRLNRSAAVANVTLGSPGPTRSSYGDVRELDEIDRVLEVVEVDCSLHGHENDLVFKRVANYSTSSRRPASLAYSHEKLLA